MLTRRAFIQVLATIIASPVVLASEPESTPFDWNISNGVLTIKNFDITEYGNIVPPLVGKFTETGFDSVIHYLPFIDIEFIETIENINNMINYKYHVNIKVLLPKTLRLVAVYANDKQII